MSKGLRHLNDPKAAVDRRLRQGGGGLGVLAAKDYQDKKEMARLSKKHESGQELSAGEMQEAVRIVHKGKR